MGPPWKFTRDLLVRSLLSKLNKKFILLWSPSTSRPGYRAGCRSHRLRHDATYMEEGFFEPPLHPLRRGICLLFNLMSNSAMMLLAENDSIIFRTDCLFIVRPQLSACWGP